MGRTRKERVVDATTPSESASAGSESGSESSWVTFPETESATGSETGTGYRQPLRWLVGVYGLLPWEGRVWRAAPSVVLVVVMVAYIGGAIVFFRSENSVDVLRVLMPVFIALNVAYVVVYAMFVRIQNVFPWEALVDKLLDDDAQAEWRCVERQSGRRFCVLAASACVVFTATGATLPSPILGMAVEAVWSLSFGVVVLYFLWHLSLLGHAFVFASRRLRVRFVDNTASPFATEHDAIDALRHLAFSIEETSAAYAPVLIVWLATLGFVGVALLAAQLALELTVGERVFMGVFFLGTVFGPFMATLLFLSRVDTAFGLIVKEVHAKDVWCCGEDGSSGLATPRLLAFVSAIAHDASFTVAGVRITYLLTMRIVAGTLSAVSVILTFASSNW